MIFRKRRFLEIEEDYDGIYDKGWVDACSNKRVYIADDGRYLVNGSDGLVYEMEPEWVE